MTELTYNFPKISDGEHEYYGGRQQCLPTKTLQGFGCGLISAANILLCLDRRDGQYRGFFGKLRGDHLALLPFVQLVMILKRYIPILPKIGVNGLSLVWGMRFYFLRYRLPYRVRWCISGKKLWSRMEEMLKKGIPVLFCVGPNFPRFRDPAGVNFYKKTENGEYKRALSIKEHYVTVTGMDDEWVKVSSWGYEYYVNRVEYEAHVREHSNYIFNNIALVREK